MRFTPTRAGQPSLSVFCMTAGPGARVAALLESLRPVADEILVAVDSRADASTRSDLAAVADRLVVYPYAEPVDRPLPWLFGQCRGAWAFSVDDDEIPSRALIDALPGLCADASVVYYWLPRRWLYPDASSYLADSPWRPDYQLRLFRTDSRLIRFSNEFHRPILAAGPGRFLQLPLWHADTILRPTQHRLEKARRYERTRPGLRIGGRSLNFAFFLPELRPEPSLAAGPPEERAHVEAILEALSPAGEPLARLEEVARDQIDRLWPTTDPSLQSGVLELLETAPALSAGEERTLDVRVRNTGSATWPWGADGVPPVRVASRWYDGSGRELAELQIHTVLPAPLSPGAAELVPTHVRAPEAAGTYRIELELVHQHVRRFGEPTGLEVTVRPRRRVLVVGDDAAFAAVAEVLECVPELELVRLRRTPATLPEGHPEAPDGRAYLFDGAPDGRLVFAATLLWRGLRLRVGEPARARSLTEALRGSELLVVAGLDGPDQRRERWAAGLVQGKARSLGVPVAVTRSPEEILSRLQP